MTRQVILFGNGLGRSINAQKYSLETALHGAWLNDNVLSGEQKELIHQCLPSGVLEAAEDLPPTSENELDVLYRVLNACDEIQKHQQLGGADWLTEHGKSFPTAIRRFIHSAACYFHEGQDQLPQEFTNPLKTHILATKSHVATLNYDELLYRSFIGTEIFSGYSCLIDGFSYQVFDHSNLDRFHPSDQGYYLHLHGSPLYLTDHQGVVRKYALSDIGRIKGTSSIHLVLAHIGHKKGIIQASEVLSEYWRRLDEAMKEVNRITLFGYGGGDTHLNELIIKNFSHDEDQVLIVQHIGEDTKEIRKKKLSFWKSKLGPSVKFSVFFQQSLLDFNRWDYVHNFEG